MRVELAGHALQLLASGAALHVHSQQLLVADAHLGKDVSLRALGMPVPEQATAQTLQTLGRDLAATQAIGIVFLGDLLHAARSKTPALLAMLSTWRNLHAAVRLTLVRGNHDERAGDPPADLGFDVVNEPFALHAPTQTLPLALCHHPQTVPGHYALAGHWHPCITLHGKARQRLRLPCFWFGDESSRPEGVLPAYGEFTGGHPIERRALDRVFVCSESQVHNLP
jgi:uncharacterized protein